MKRNPSGAEAPRKLKLRLPGGVLIGSTRSLRYIDPAVTANTSCRYTVKAEDFFTNLGGGVENIDMRSGNLDCTLGMMQAQSRDSLSMGFSLNYKSQTWCYGDGINWNVGTDVGTGYGFKPRYFRCTMAGP